ncbi:hypothetical protein MIMGU_mgv1a026406mg, partial [Erythranthe guttata]
MMSKFTDDKLNRSNYFDWSKPVRLYLRSIDKDNHMVDDPPKDESNRRFSYFMDFKQSYEELNMLLPFSSDVKVPQKQHEQMVVMSFLAGLLSKFEIAEVQVLSGGSNVNFDTRRPDSGVVVCHYCHNPGHMKRNCWMFQNMSQKTHYVHVASHGSILIFGDEFWCHISFRDT